MESVIIITGSQNSGKTSLIEEVTTYLQEKDIPICGLISPGVYTNGKRTAINVVNLETQEERRMAEFKPGFDPSMLEKKWKMNDDVFEWGNDVLSSLSTKGKVLLLDELGIYELLENKGWTNAIEIIKQNDQLLTVVTVRKEMIERFIKICESNKILRIVHDIDKIGRDSEKVLKSVYKTLQSSTEK